MLVLVCGCCVWCEVCRLAVWCRCVIGCGVRCDGCRRKEKGSQGGGEKKRVRGREKIVVGGLGACGVAGGASAARPGLAGRVVSVAD